MLGTRLVTGFLMAGVLVAILCLDEWLAPWFPLWLILTLAATTAAAVELVGLLSLTSARPSGQTVIGGVLALTLANWVPHLMTEFHHLPQFTGRIAYNPLTPVDALAWPLMTFAAVVMAAFITESIHFQKPGGTMAAVSGTVLATAYVGLLGSFIVQMRWLDGPYHGLLPLASLVATAKGADIGAYTCGRIAGRHKLWPRLSPNKTVEGAVGGLAFAVLGAIAVSLIGGKLLGAPSLGLGGAIMFGLVVGTAAQLGDLMESMIKRDCARKDASDAVPGFGGVLDVLDSLLFAGPVAFAFWLAAGA